MPNVRPIDANALIEKLKYWRVDLEDVDMNDGYDVGSYATMCRAIIISENAPVLEYAPVRHGEWVEGLCSACGVEAECTIIEEPVYDYDWEENLRFSHFETKRIHHETKFCPNCGAVMDGGKEDG